MFGGCAPLECLLNEAISVLRHHRVDGVCACGTIDASEGLLLLGFACESLFLFVWRLGELTLLGALAAALLALFGIGLVRQGGLLRRHIQPSDPITINGVCARVSGSRSTDSSPHHDEVLL